MPETPTGRVTTIIKDGIAAISFFHPAQNSLPSDLLARLTEDIKNAGADANVRVIVIKSEGDRTFCAGASFDELLRIKNKMAGAQFFSGFAPVINSLRKNP